MQNTGYLLSIYTLHLLKDPHSKVLTYWQRQPGLMVKYPTNASFKSCRKYCKYKVSTTKHHHHILIITYELMFFINP